MALSLFDQAMMKYEGKNWTFCMNDAPEQYRKVAADIEDPISFADFTRDACRQPGNIKSASVLMDYHSSVPEFGLIENVFDFNQGQTLGHPA